MSSSSDRFTTVTDELAKYPSAVLEEFQSAHSQLESVVTPEELDKWMARGLSVATLTVRSWEAASEFFRSSLSIHQLVGGVRSSLGYCGASSIADCHKKAKFIRIKEFLT